MNRNASRDMTGKILNLMLGILISLLLVFIPRTQNVWAATEGTGDEPVGSAQQIQGISALMRAGETDFRALKEFEPIYVQDVIHTRGNSKLWWTMDRTDADESDASLGAESSLKFFAYHAHEAGSAFVGGMQRGSARFVKKLHNTNPASAFIVATPTALVQVVPTEEAADFVIQVIDSQRTIVTVLWGKVVVKNIAEELTQARLLRSCRSTLIEQGRPPLPSAWVSADRLIALISQTTIPGTLPMAIPSCSDAAIPEELVPPVSMLQTEAPMVQFSPPPALVVGLDGQGAAGPGDPGLGGPNNPGDPGKPDGPGKPGDSKNGKPTPVTNKTETLDPSKQLPPNGGQTKAGGPFEKAPEDITGKVSQALTSPVKVGSLTLEEMHNLWIFNPKKCAKLEGGKYKCPDGKGGSIIVGGSDTALNPTQLLVCSPDLTKCWIQECPGCQSWDDSNNCVPHGIQIDCKKYGGTWSESHCHCEYPEGWDKKCGCGKWIMSVKGGGKCLPPDPCPAGQKRNEKTCKCEGSSECPPCFETVVDPKTGKKICLDPQSCPAGQVLNQKTCKCEGLNCPPCHNTVYDPNLEITYCDRPICGGGENFNEKTCKCEGPKCPPCYSTVVNLKTGKKECKFWDPCPAGTKMNEKTCKCEEWNLCNVDGVITVCKKSKSSSTGSSPNLPGGIRDRLPIVKKPDKKEDDPEIGNKKSPVKQPETSESTPDSFTPPTQPATQQPPDRTPGKPVELSVEAISSPSKSGGSIEQNPGASSDQAQNSWQNIVTTKIIPAVVPVKIKPAVTDPDAPYAGAKQLPVTAIPSPTAKPGASLVKPGDLKILKPGVSIEQNPGSPKGKTSTTGVSSQTSKFSTGSGSKASAKKTEALGKQDQLIQGTSKTLRKDPPKLSPIQASPAKVSNPVQHKPMLQSVPLGPKSPVKASSPAQAPSATQAMPAQTIRRK